MSSLSKGTLPWEGRKGSWETGRTPGLSRGGGTLSNLNNNGNSTSALDIVGSQLVWMDGRYRQTEERLMD